MMRGKSTPSGVLFQLISLKRANLKCQDASANFALKASCWLKEGKSGFEVDEVEDVRDS